MHRAEQGPADVEGVGRLVERLVTRPPLTGRVHGKLPWDDEEFSARMLREHLDPTHDRASRRTSTVDAHVEWIVLSLLDGTPGRVLDLGCGPGLYTERLAERGCTCLGIDISPASIDHARRTADGRGLDCTYVLGDIRSVDLGTGHDLAMLLFGEFNTFTREDASTLLQRAATCVRPGGTVLLEAHTFESIVAEGMSDDRWYTSRSGLFSPGPHVVLMEHVWDESTATAATRLHVVDDRGTVDEYAEALQAYTDTQYRDAMLAAGLATPTVAATAGPFDDPSMLVVTACRPEHAPV